MAARVVEIEALQTEQAVNDLFLANPGVSCLVSFEVLATREHTYCASMQHLTMKEIDLPDH
jgi:hypothetical protein